MMSKDDIAKIIGVTLFAFLFLNYPFIGLFEKKYFILGIPLLHFYAAIIWLILIIITALLLNKKEDRHV